MAPFNFKSKLGELSRLLNVTLILVLVLYFGRTLFIPMSFGLLIAAVCYPVSKRLESRGWPRSLSVALLISVVTIVFLSLLVLLGYELSLLAANKEVLAQKLNNEYVNIRSWLTESLGIKMSVQTDVWNGAIGNLGGVFSNVLSTTTSTIVSLILVPIFGALFLLHRGTFITFLESLAGGENSGAIRPILHESLTSYFRFVKGSFFVYCIVACLNSIGLLILGIDHAVLFGVIAAFMTIIPYVGILISASLPISIALITKDSWWYAGGVVAVFSIVQYLEANIIFPRIVGQQMNLSTWAVLVAMIIGTLLWGLAGMILFVPFAGMLNTISSHAASLRPLNILLSRKMKTRK